ncbi:GntR family transcriptional regulator [Povalibacter sp.]|uniref:GntR family transcriptional regulator n=1 Tax=Povalibacter sp. TaxID=1962978 RepID=UPI002F42C123
MRASDLAYTTVRDRIVRGIYLGASRITEQEIADSTGVSRTPVREALRRLQAEGFVRVTANHGAIVTDLTEQDITDVFDLRALLEPYGAARAAQVITPEGVGELRGLAEEQHRESIARSPGFSVRIRELNNSFHQVLHGFSGNPRLTAMLPVLMAAPLVLKAFETYKPSELLRSVSHHLEIVSALEVRDSEWAASIMRSHIQAARRSSLRPTAQFVTAQVVQSGAKSEGSEVRLTHQTGYRDQRLAASPGCIEFPEDPD